MLPQILKYPKGNGINELIKLTQTEYDALTNKSFEKLYIIMKPIEYVIQDAVGTNNYGFRMNSNEYYESQNQGIGNSYSLAKVIFQLEEQTNITIKFINYAESGCDYGIFGNVDQILSASSNTDSTYKLNCHDSSYNKSAVQTLTYQNIPAGQHFIMIKYRKDGSVDSYNDSLQFQIVTD